MARYMLDTNILYFMIDEQEDRLSNDVYSIVFDYCNTLYISSETLKELVVAYRGKSLLANRWKTADDMVNAIINDSNVEILPVDRAMLSAAWQNSKSTRLPTIKTRQTILLLPTL